MIACGGARRLSASRVRGLSAIVHVQGLWSSSLQSRPSVPAADGARPRHGQLEAVPPAMRLDRRVVLSTAQLAALSILPLDRRRHLRPIAFARVVGTAAVGAARARQIRPTRRCRPGSKGAGRRRRRSSSLPRRSACNSSAPPAGQSPRPRLRRDTRAQLGRPVKLEVAFGPQHEERAANTAARLNAFAGREVVKRARDCEASDGGLLAGQPAACTLIEYSGPIDQKSLINRVRVEADADQVDDPGGHADHPRAG